ncbi:MAG TPA: DUF5753 domain-containing protein [Streptosporangiaceae bacterium]
MPRDERPAALDRFSKALWLAWTKAGPPSYSEFEKRSEEVLGRSRRLSSSTTQEILTRHRRKPPRWDWVGRFWTVLQVIAAEGGDIDPDRLGALDALKELHDAAWEAWRRTCEPAAASGTSGRAHPSSAAVPEHAPEADGIASIRRVIGVEWWHDYDDVVPSWAGTYLSLEPAAKLIHCYETAVVPGLLQTEAYAGAVLQLAHMLPESDITRMVKLRMRRQQILIRPNPPRIWAVFDETALRREFGDEAIMRQQIEHLLVLSKLPNVTIQLIPSITRIRVALGYPITLLRFYVHDIPDVVYLEQLMNAYYLHNPDHVSRYAQVLTGLSAEALKPAETADHLRQML